EPPSGAKYSGKSLRSGKCRFLLFALFSEIDIWVRRGEFRHMEIHELVVEMKLLERRLTLYEQKYGVLSEYFYAALLAGERARSSEKGAGGFGCEMDWTLLRA